MQRATNRDSAANLNGRNEDNSQAKPEEQNASSYFKLIINVGMILAGSFATIFGKIIDQRVALPKETINGEVITVETEFRHPLIMNLLMFSGESILLLVLALQLSKDPAAAARH